MTPADLLAWRRRLGLSQSEAARLLHTPVATLRNWERGRRPIPSLMALATAYVEKHPPPTAM